MKDPCADLQGLLAVDYTFHRASMILHTLQLHTLPQYIQPAVVHTVYVISEVIAYMIYDLSDFLTSILARIFNSC